MRLKSFIPGHSTYLPIRQSVRLPLRLFMAGILAVSAVLPAQAQSTSPKIIFPGQSLPGDVGYQPLSWGRGSDVDVSVMEREWFLLRDRHYTTRSFDYVGPVLGTVNVQQYYRLMSGLILQESMMQMGMSRAQAQRYLKTIAEAGVDFEKSTVDQLISASPLPTGISELANNWYRPLNRLAVIPYLVLPLTVAYDQSQLQHFATGSLKGQSFISGCGAQRTSPSIVPAQTKLNQLISERSQLIEAVKASEALLEKSNNESTRLTVKIEQMSDEVQKKMTCFSTIRDRISRGTAMPAAECLQLAESAVTADARDSGAQWKRFASINLPNGRGDFTIRQESEVTMKALEARLQAAQKMLESLQDQNMKVNQKITEARANIEKLNGDRAKQAEIETVIRTEADKLTAEFQALQTLNHKIERGVLNQEMTDAEVQQAVAQTPQRRARIEAIKARQAKLLSDLGRVQANQTAINTQIDFLTRSVDSNTALNESLQEQLGPDAKPKAESAQSQGLRLEIARLSTETEAARAAFLKASDTFNFAESVVALLSRHLILLGQARDLEFQALQREESLIKQYQAQIKAAITARDSRLPKLATEVANAETVLAAFQQETDMGWFLENECDSRLQYDTGAPALYLSRAPMATESMSPASASSTVPAALRRLDGGRWGLFNLDYRFAQTSIQNGILTNVPNLIEQSVRQLFKNYDFLTSQSLDAAFVQKCPELNVAGKMAPLVFLRGSFSLWDEGSQANAQVNASCRLSEAPGAPGADSNRQFAASLLNLMRFEGSVLDKALPKAGQSKPSDLIERMAIQTLFTELAALSGTAIPASLVVSSEERRDRLVKSLLQILATDYRAEMAKAGEATFKETPYVFASAAPGRNLAETERMQVGQTLKVRTLQTLRAYKTPIAKPEHEIPSNLGWGDEVQVLAVDPTLPTQAVQSGWMRVQKKGSNQALYVSAGSMSQNGTMVDEDGREIYNIGDPQICPVMRLVTEVRNLDPRDRVITRLLPEIKIIPFRNTKRFQMAWGGNQRTTTGDTAKRYVACEILKSPGKKSSDPIDETLNKQAGFDYSDVFGIRIVEVRELRTPSGEIRYIPVENYGGFAHPFLNTRVDGRPRIVVGPALDRQTWSVTK